MANANGKSIDKTFLSLDNASDRGFLHRDYIAHCMRWSHVVKRLYERKAYESARIIDVGCGREFPMAKMLHSQKLKPLRYCGIDVGNIDWQEHEWGSYRDRFMFQGNTDVCDLQTIGCSPWQAFNWLICFEVLEHVEPEHCLRMLDKFKQLLTPDGRAFISTPCWDVKSCAANHVNEMRYETLGRVFEEAGFTIMDVHGTFASISDYYDKMTKEHRETFDDLREYYDTNFLACVLAPFYPAYSRNCLWELAPTRGSQTPYMFKPLNEVRQPWSSSNKWLEMERGSV